MPLSQNSPDPSEPDQFEAELRRLRPAAPPEEYISRMADLLAKRPRPPQHSAICSSQSPDWRWFVRWLAPGMALILVIAVYSWHGAVPGAKPQNPSVPRPARSALKADHIEIDSRLVADFDTVAQLPNGEPMRFRCRKWADAVVLRDSRRGITIENQTPRLEVIPISMETY